MNITAIQAFLTVVRSGNLNRAAEQLNVTQSAVTTRLDTLEQALGAKLLVDGAKSVALELGMSEAAVGLTIVAIGTSLPELATTVMAAIRRQADVAVGNVIGSNLFNILAVMGGSALFGALPTPAGFLELDFWIMLAASLALAPFIFLKRTMTRTVGVIFLLAYVAYIALALGPRM